MVQTAEGWMPSTAIKPTSLSEASVTKNVPQSQMYAAGATRLLLLLHLFKCSHLHVIPCIALTLLDNRKSMLYNESSNYSLPWKILLFNSSDI